MNTNSAVNLMPAQASNSETYQNYANIQGLDSLKQQAREDERSALKPVAQQFEALFVQQVLKEARKVSFDEGWLDGNQGDFYKDWHDKQLAQDLAAKGNLGFADKIVEQLSPSIPMVANTQVSNDSDTKLKAQTSVENNKTNFPSTEEALALRLLK